MTSKEKRKAYREANRERLMAYDKARYHANKERHAIRRKAYYDANREEQIAYSKAHYWSHKEERAAYNKAYREAHKEKAHAERKAWGEANKEKISAYNKKRYMDDPSYKRVYDKRLKAAILPSTDLDKIKELYIERDRLTKKHGVKYHVDHIIPICKGGAHHQDNMRVITAHENQTKQGRYTPELGGLSVTKVKEPLA